MKCEQEKIIDSVNNMLNTLGNDQEYKTQCQDMKWVLDDFGNLKFDERASVIMYCLETTQDMLAQSPKDKILLELNSKLNYALIPKKALSKGFTNLQKVVKDSRSNNIKGLLGILSQTYSHKFDSVPVGFYDLPQMVSASVKDTMQGDYIGADESIMFKEAFENHYGSYSN